MVKTFFLSSEKESVLLSSGDDLNPIHAKVRYCNEIIIINYLISVIHQFTFRNLILKGYDKKTVPMKVLKYDPLINFRQIQIELNEIFCCHT